MNIGSGSSHLYVLAACEASGDALGAGLMKGILARDSKAVFAGIYGPLMRAVSGSKGQLVDMEELSVMGIGEVLKSLPRILKLRKQFISTVKKLNPLVFVGIDAPDFNLRIEKKLHDIGIPSIHYVSPSVWAWRSGRIKTIRESVDMVLSIFPFEKKIYDENKVPCTYVGQRLAREIPLENSITAARMSLKFSESAMKSNQITGVLPGSRNAEINFLTSEFAEAAYKLSSSYPAMRFICAATSDAKAKVIARLWNQHAPRIPLTIWVGRSQEVMAASNALMIASGTAALEAMLYKKRMVVCYIVSQITAMIGRRVLKVSDVSLPNILAGRRIVPELIQENCTPENIKEEISKIYTDDNREQLKEFTCIHQMMRMDSDALAADAVLKVIKDHNARQQALAAAKESANKKSAAEKHIAAEKNNSKA